MKLYEIASEHLRSENEIRVTDGVITDEEWNELQRLDDRLEDKVDAVGPLIAEAEGAERAKGNEAQRLNASAKSDKNRTPATRSMLAALLPDDGSAAGRVASKKRWGLPGLESGPSSCAGGRGVDRDSDASTSESPLPAIRFESWRNGDSCHVLAPPGIRFVSAVALAVRAGHHGL